MGGVVVVSRVGPDVAGDFAVGKYRSMMTWERAVRVSLRYSSWLSSTTLLRLGNGASWKIEVDLAKIRMAGQ